MNENLYALIAARAPADADACAIETHDARYWTWRDLDRAAARIAHLLASLALPEGSRIAVQVDKSVEALCLYLATLRAGHVFLPLNSAYQQAEIDAFQRKSTETKAQLKELRRTLRLETDSLELVTKVINIGLMPTLVAFAGIGLFAIRRRRGGR
jgi:acyl-CoA synthetase (AMP-forming)/AMP-acid ligase II